MPWGRSFDVIQAAMMLNASAAVATRFPPAKAHATVQLETGDVVTAELTGFSGDVVRITAVNGVSIDKDMRRDMRTIERASAMYGKNDRAVENRNEHSRGKRHVRMQLKAEDRRREADTKISAAQAKRDRKAAKRAAAVAITDPAHTCQGSV